MPARAYTTPHPETTLWRDLDQLAEEQAVLTWFREPEYRYRVDTQPPDFLIRKARPTKWSTQYWVQIKGRIETRNGQTIVELQSGYTNDGKMGLGLSAVFLLAWPPLWFMVLNPNTWLWSVPLTLFLGGFLSIYLPVRRFHRFLINRWQLHLLTSDLSN